MTRHAVRTALDRYEDDEVRRIVEAEPDVLDVEDDGGTTLLVELVYRRRPDLARELAGRKGALDIFEAAALGRPDRVRALAEYAAHWSGDGYTPLHLAAAFATEETVQTLVELGADPDAPARDPMARTPVHCAVAEGRAGNATVLLDAGADVNARQSGGFTALHIAAHRGDAASVGVLLSHGALASLVDDLGYTAGDLAEAGGHTGLVPDTDGV